MNARQHILAATDLSLPAAQAVERAAQLAAAAGACLTLLHVLEDAADEEAARADLQALAAGLQERHGVAASLRLIGGRVSEALCAEADALDAALLVLGARGRGLVEELLLGSTAEQVMNGCRRPLLIVRAPQQAAYRRLLVPVDFSPRSRQAVELARHWLPQSTLTLLHAFELPFEGRLRHAGVGDSELGSLLARALQEAREDMRRFMSAQALDETPAQPLIVHGAAVPKILDLCSPQRHDLLVIGRRAQGVLSELMLGSVTRNILQQAGIDVLVF